MLSLLAGLISYAVESLKPGKKRILTESFFSCDTCLRRRGVNATKVANKEHEVTMKLDGQVQPLPCKVAEQINMSQMRKKAIY